MKHLPLTWLTIAAVLAVSGCASSGGSRDEGDYMGVGYPGSAIYYGHDSYDYYDDYPDYIVTPRPPGDTSDRPDYKPGLKPEHPIVVPPASRPNRPATLPAYRPSSGSRTPSASHHRARAPSIPSRPRPGGGMRGGGRRR